VCCWDFGQRNFTRCVCFYLEKSKFRPQIISFVDTQNYTSLAEMINYSGE
jgi:hypothetical protein